MENRLFENGVKFVTSHIAAGTLLRELREFRLLEFRLLSRRYLNQRRDIQPETRRSNPAPSGPLYFSDFLAADQASLNIKVEVRKIAGREFLKCDRSHYGVVRT